MGLKQILTRGSALTLLFLMLLGYQNCSAPFQVNPNLSTTFGSSGPTGGGPVTKVGVFMASGHMGRTVMSCDDGVTWIRDQSANDAARCWTTGDPNDIECDHQPTAGRGMDYSDGAFYVNNGWGANGTARRSTDGGQTWSILKSDGWGPGIGAIGNKLLLLWGGWQISSDTGATWSTIAAAPTNLDHPTLRKVAGRFITFDLQGHMSLSEDQGATWMTPSGLGGFGIIDVAGTSTRLVLIGHTQTYPSTGYSAVSTDGGHTWASTPITDPNWGNSGWAGSVIYDGSQFVSWANGFRFKSLDGVNWSSAAVTFTPAPNASFVGNFAYSKISGTYTMITNVWAQYYSGQRAFRSTDGLNWTTLDTAHFKGGHPLSSLVYGEIDSNVCP